MSMEATEFRTLVETHQKMVFSIALRVTGEYGAAEEVAQDVFLELYRGSERLTGEDHVRFWLRRVTVHRATDALRRKSRQPEAAAEEWMEDQHVEDDGGRMDPSVVARLEELLLALPETMRVAVVLRYQEEMLPDEIAKLLNQPVATVKSNLQRGLQLLRRKAAVTMKEYVRGQS
jgi:RNA polymerase sigma-70 factor, ECF subfamily